ncbi:hypothetical protein, partial [Pseudorhodoplanes sp.]|uniref:hypothetical protein n=1 Tax=Pseudorhodoplanes sp. TaxID=1934341 RepID=UPI00391DFAD0
ILNQAHRLKLELSRKLPSLHDHPPVPLKHLTRCLRNRVQARKARRLLRDWSRSIALALAVIVFGLAALGSVGGYLTFARDPIAFVKSSTGGDAKFRELINTHFKLKVSEAALSTMTDDEYADLADDEPRLWDRIYHCENSFGHDDRCALLVEKVASARTEQAFVMDLLTDRLADADFQGQLGKQLLFWSIAFVFINAAVMVFSFLLSLSITLFLMRAMEKVRVSSLLVCLIDLFLAVAVPIAVLTAVVTIVVFTVPTSVSDIKAGPQFANDLARYIASFAFGASVFPLVFSKSMYSVFLNGDGSFERFLLLWWGIWIYGLHQFQEFTSSMLAVLKGDISSVNIEAAQRNWTVAASILFSLSYIGYVAFLLIARRSAGFRALVERVLKFFVEHPKGPLGAASLLVAGALFLADRYLT